MKNSTYFITRRCTQRLFLLKPTKLTSNIFLYCLAVAAKKFGIIIHAVCVISNHYHAIVSDPDARIAEFYCWLHKYVAKAVNASLGRFENMWSSEKTNVISLDNPGDVLEKTVYTLSNPVEARLVARGEKWPGVWLYKRSHSRTVKRPEVYFREEGEMPERVELCIERPPQFQEMSEEEYEDLVSGELAEREREIRCEMEARGQSFLGVRGVLNQHHYSSPLSRAKRFGIKHTATHRSVN